MEILVGAVVLVILFIAFRRAVVHNSPTDVPMAIPLDIPSGDNGRQCGLGLLASVEYWPGFPDGHDIAGAAAPRSGRGLALQVLQNSEAELQERYVLRRAVEDGGGLYRGGSGVESHPGDHGRLENPLFERAGTVIANRQRCY